MRMHWLDNEMQLWNMFRSRMVASFTLTWCSSDARLWKTYYGSPTNGWSEQKPVSTCLCALPLDRIIFSANTFNSAVSEWAFKGWKNDWKSGERTETNYNTVVHSKYWRMGAVVVGLHEGIVSYGLIKSVQAIFQIFSNFLGIISFLSPYYQ